MRTGLSSQKPALSGERAKANIPSASQKPTARYAKTRLGRYLKISSLSLPLARTLAPRERDEEDPKHRGNARFRAAGDAPNRLARMNVRSRFPRMASECPQKARHLLLRPLGAVSSHAGETSR